MPTPSWMFYSRLHRRSSRPRSLLSPFNCLHRSPSRPKQLPPHGNISTQEPLEPTQLPPQESISAQKPSNPIQLPPQKDILVQEPTEPNLPPPQYNSSAWVPLQQHPLLHPWVENSAAVPLQHQLSCHLHGWKTRQEFISAYYSYLYGQKTCQLSKTPLLLPHSRVENSELSTTPPSLATSKGGQLSGTSMGGEFGSCPKPPPFLAASVSVLPHHALPLPPQAELLGC